MQFLTFQVLLRITRFRRTASSLASIHFRSFFFLVISSFYRLYTQTIPNHCVTTQYCRDNKSSPSRKCSLLSMLFLVSKLNGVVLTLEMQCSDALRVLCFVLSSCRSKFSTLIRVISLISSTRNENKEPDDHHYVITCILGR